MTANLEKLVGRYVELREAKRALEKGMADKLAPYADAMEKLEARMFASLSEAGAKSVRTPHGTVYLEDKKTADIVDFDQLWAYARENDKPEIFQRRLSISEVYNLNEADPETPVPGVRTELVRNVKVRKT